MRVEDKSASAALPFLEGLAEKSVRDLLSGAYLQRFPSHVELVEQGRHADFLHVVVEGQIEVFSRHRDRETTVSILGPGHCFILAAVFLDQVYLKSARTISPARLLLLPAAAVHAVFGSDPVFAHRIAAEMAKGYRRLANWILRQAPGSGPTSSFTFPFDKKTLASKLGVTPEVLSRNFGSLIPYGVTIDGKSVVVKDRAVLETLAKPDPLIDDPAA